MLAHAASGSVAIERVGDLVAIQRYDVGGSGTYHFCGLCVCMCGCVCEDAYVKDTGKGSN